MIDRLVALGHRRIVIILREEHRLPQPGVFARSLLEAMKAHGLSTGPYNLPAWENHPADLRRCSDSLFQVTPPTAMLVEEAMLSNVVQQHLARQGILAPQHISLVCNDPDPSFEWASPSVAHIRWDSRVLVRRVADWAEQMARGKEFRRQSEIQAEFVERGTIGVAAIE